MNDTIKKPHYVCMGSCEGVADSPGSCASDECTKQGEPLQMCACADGSHASHDNGGNETSEM